MVERTGEKCWLLDCNSDLYFTLVKWGLQAKQRLAGATARRWVDRQPWDFLLSHPVCQYSVTPGIAVMTSFSRSVCNSRSLLQIAHMRAVKLLLKLYMTEEIASLGLSPYL